MYMPYITKTRPSIYKTVSTSDLTFTALKVSEGDAFLLQRNDGKNFLVDSGIRNEIVTPLKNLVSNIDIAICTHNDADHTDGLIELLKQKFPINEIWLPGIWANILQFIISKRDTAKVIFDIEHYIDSLSAGDIRKKKESSLDSLFGDTTVSVDELKSGLSDLAERYNNLKKINSTKSPLNIAFNNILTIATSAYNNGSNIRWFEPVKGCTNLHVDEGFVALNSYPMSQIQTIKSVPDVVDALCLTTVNKYSLAFEYYWENHPVIRFSADSDSDCKTVEKYTDSIIITAPHHGSASNKDVYKLDSDKAIWVRTCHHQIQMPCDKFLNVKNRYCLRCDPKGIFDQIRFEYIGDEWIRQEGNKCICEPSKSTP